MLPLGVCLAVAVVVKLVSSYFHEDAAAIAVNHHNHHHGEDDHDDEKEQQKQQQQRQGQTSLGKERFTGSIGGVNHQHCRTRKSSSIARQKAPFSHQRNKRKRPRLQNDTVAIAATAATTREAVRAKWTLWMNPFYSEQNVVITRPSAGPARDHAVVARRKRRTSQVDEDSPPPSEQQGRRGKRRKLQHQVTISTTTDYSSIETNESILPQTTDTDAVIVIADAASGSRNTLPYSPDFLLLPSSLSSSNSVTAVPEKSRAITTTKNNHYRAPVKNQTFLKASEGKRRVYSSTRTVGSRCYVKHPNRQWYWATLMGVHGGPPLAQQTQPRSNARPVINRRTTRFSFKFEVDDETIENVGFDDFLTEKEYADVVGEPSPPMHSSDSINNMQLNPRELFRERCRTCSMCCATDCGTCRTCVENKESTTSYRQVCLRKMCLNILEDSKGQPVPGLQGWFYVSCPPKQIAKLGIQASGPPLHDELKCLYLFHPQRGIRVRGFETAVELTTAMTTGDQRTTKERDKLAFDFYNSFFGTRVTVKEEDHPLVGKGYCHEWTDASDSTLAVYGRIVLCERDFGHDKLSFTVEFQNESRRIVNMRLGAVEMEVPERRLVDEKMAYGGCLLYDLRVSSAQGSKVPRLNSTRVPNFTLHWLVPPAKFVSRVESLPRQCLMMSGYNIELEVAPSSIPNAGLGVFARCMPLTEATTNVDFELQPGELLDLGLYAPLRASDKKPEATAMLKSFLLKWKTQSWHFDVHASDRERLNCLFDFTNDLDGKLEDWSSHSVASYVNETNGKEVPSVHAFYDPSGGVHYLLGHLKGKPFRLPACGAKVEIKIDYGPKYEKVRVAQGYPRVGRENQKKLLRELEEDDFQYLNEIRNASANQLIDDVRFLRKYVSHIEDLPATTRERILLVAANIVVRLVAIEKEIEEAKDDICDNGFSLLGKDRTMSKAVAVLLSVTKTWDTPEELHESVFANELYQTSMANILKDAETLTPEDFREKLLLLGRKTN